MRKLCFLFMFLLLFGCFDAKEKKLSQEEIDAQTEAERKTDSLVNFSKKVIETRNLTQSFSGVHNHIMGSGNLAFDAHQDPVKTRRMIENYAKLAERYKEYAPKIEEGRQKMIKAYKEAQKEEEKRVY
jgi:maltooligosyltrehalose synthase